MNDAKHTPGPWSASRDATKTSNFGGWHVRVNAAMIGVAKAYGTERVAVEANARLVAAAPDLLAALQELLDAGDHSATATDDVEAMLRFGDAVNDARAAIAKATT